MALIFYFLKKAGVLFYGPEPGPSPTFSGPARPEPEVQSPVRPEPDKTPARYVPIFFSDAICCLSGDGDVERAREERSEAAAWRTQLTTGEADTLGKKRDLKGNIMKGN